MLSLRALLAQHSCVLLIDSASARIQIGLLRPGHAPLWKTENGEAGTTLFALAEQLLAEAGDTTQPLPLSAIDAFVFCDGPGSVLGIRTAAIALRTWAALKPRPLYAYSSLAVVARSLAAAGAPTPFAVIADARRETWHRVEVDAAGEVSPVKRVASSELRGTLFMPADFRHWSALPAGTRTASYDIGAQLAGLTEAPLFRPAPEPDAFLHEEPSYQTWTPQVHRAPA